jgi:ADP-ribose pyrophosphatase YjhB (NUDIX family)
MSEEKGQAGGLAEPGIASASASTVSRDARGASSGDLVSKWHHRLLRILLHRWFRLSRGMTLGVRAMVLDDAGRVFLVRHSYVPGWHLPGGGVEAGQSAREALAMELSEEGNLVLTGEPLLFGVYQNRNAAPRDHVLLYIVRAFRQTAPRLPDREIVECGFFALDALPEETTAGTCRRIEEVTRSAPVSPHW